MIIYFFFFLKERKEKWLKLLRLKDLWFSVALTALTAVFHLILTFSEHYKASINERKRTDCSVLEVFQN